MRSRSIATAPAFASGYSSSQGKRGAWSLGSRTDWGGKLLTDGDRVWGLLDAADPSSDLLPRRSLRSPLVVGHLLPQGEKESRGGSLSWLTANVEEWRGWRCRPSFSPCGRRWIGAPAPRRMRVCQPGKSRAASVRPAFLTRRGRPRRRPCAGCGPGRRARRGWSGWRGGRLR